MSEIDFDTIYNNGLSKTKTVETKLSGSLQDKYVDFCKSLIEKYSSGKTENMIGLAAYCLRRLIMEPNSDVTLDNLFKID